MGKLLWRVLGVRGSAAQPREAEGGTDAEPALPDAVAIEEAAELEPAVEGDSIPIHLLTEEAFKLYFEQLKPNGVLAVHVSNKYLDLKPIVKLAAQALGKESRVIDTDDDEEDSEAEQLDDERLRRPG